MGGVAIKDPNFGNPPSGSTGSTGSAASTGPDGSSHPPTGTTTVVLAVTVVPSGPGVTVDAAVPTTIPIPQIPNSQSECSKQGGCGPSVGQGQAGGGGGYGAGPEVVKRYTYQYLIGRFGDNGPDLIAQMFFADPNAFFPVSIGGPLKPGTILDLDSGTMIPPGPVEVNSVGPRSFGFTSLDGHPEGAGNVIEFTFASDKYGQTVLQIDSAGPKDGKFTGPVAKQFNVILTKNLWQEFASSLGAGGYQQFPTFPCCTK